MSKVKMSNSHVAPCFERLEKVLGKTKNKVSGNRKGLWIKIGVGAGAKGKKGLRIVE